MSPRPSWSSPVPFACPACGGTRLSRLAEDVTETLEVIPRQWIGTYFSALRAPWQKGTVENPKARSRRFRPLVVDIARLRRPRPMGTASAGRGSAAKSSLRPGRGSRRGEPVWTPTMGWQTGNIKPAEFASRRSFSQTDATGEPGAARTSVGPTGFSEGFAADTMSGGVAPGSGERGRKPSPPSPAARRPHMQALSRDRRAGVTRLTREVPKPPRVWSSGGMGCDGSRLR